MPSMGRNRRSGVECILIFLKIRRKTLVVMWQKTQNLKKRRLYFYKMKESWKNSERPEGKREVGRNGGKIVWQTLGTQK